MDEDRIAPAQCRNMTEVRAGIDALDRRIVALLAERFRFMDAAARIKPERTQVRDEARKAQVIGNAETQARASGIPEGVVAALYEQLVEASIAYEFVQFDEKVMGAQVVNSSLRRQSGL